MFSLRDTPANRVRAGIAIIAIAAFVRNVRNQMPVETAVTMPAPVALRTVLTTAEVVIG